MLLKWSGLSGSSKLIFFSVKMEDFTGEYRYLNLGVTCMKQKVFILDIEDWL